MIPNKGFLNAKFDTEGSFHLPEINASHFSGISWFNRFTSIEKSKLTFSTKDGEYIHHIAEYIPNYLYEPVNRKKHYEMQLEFTATNYQEDRIWMALFIGVRVCSNVSGESNPNKTTGDFFASFSEKPNVNIYRAVIQDWPKGACSVPVMKAFDKRTSLSIIDKGKEIVFSIIDKNDNKDLLFSIDLSGPLMKVYSPKEGLIFETENKFIGKERGYFKLFNHFARTVIYSIKILEHDIEKNITKLVYKDKFKYFDSSKNYKIVQFRNDFTPFVINNTYVNILKNQLLLVSPYETHIRLDCYDTRFIIEFDDEYLYNYFSIGLVKEYNRKFNSKILEISLSKSKELFEYLNVLKKKELNKQADFLVLGSILSLISCFETAEGNIASNHNEMTHIMDYIDNNFLNIDSIDNLAKHFYLSKSHLCRSFKKVTKKTIISYINEVKVAYAIKLLKETNLTITDICTKSGFNYPAYFTSVFKEITGSTPSSLRKDFRNI